MGLETSAPPNGRPLTDAGEAAPGEARAASQSAPPERPSPAAAAPELPKIAKKADDLEAIKKAVDDAAAVGGGLCLSYLFVLFYLAVAAGAVTHADLFFENPVKLPFLNIELPLLAFFFLAPILFLIVHAYTLVHLVMLTDKAKRFHQALYTQIADEDGLPEGELARRKTIRDGLRRQLPSNIFVQFLAGPEDVRDSAFGWALQAIAWITLVVAPVLLLLLMQIQFLPFHSSFITWSQRIALLADLGLVWWLWRKILSGREIAGRHRWSSWPSTTFGLALSGAAVLFSWTAATFPGEWQEAHWPDWRVLPASSEWGEQIKVSLHDWLFNLPVGSTTRRRNSLFSSTLVLPGLNLYEGLKIDDPDKVKGRDYVFRARGQDLNGAILDFANLPKVDFTGADLEGASLTSAQLDRASFDGAQLQGALLAGARLQGASFNCEQLQDELRCAQFQGASLDEAQLQGASLNEAQLQGASLNFARLQGALLEGAQLQGASFEDAQLQGASLEQADLEGTDLSRAYLWRTNRTNSSTPPSKVSAIRMSGGDEMWLPERMDERGWLPEWTERHPWDGQAYQDLQTVMEALPLGPLGDQPLDRIQSLDCGNPDATLASCNPSASPPPEAEAWRKTLDAASADERAYADALAKVLKSLVCSGGGDATDVVRSLGFQNRLRAAGAAASDLIRDLTNKDSKTCPVSASLTDADKAGLLRVKQDATKKPGG